MTSILGREGIVGLTIVIAMIVGSIVVPAMSTFDPELSVAAPLLGPSVDHPFGTDALGRDVLVRAFTAARLDLALSLLAVTIPLLVGTVLGVLAGMSESRVIDGIWTIVVDAINALPLIVIVIALVGVFGTGIQGLMLALILTNWARYARIARVRARTLRDSPFIEAGRLLAYSRARLVVRHVTPNVLGEGVAYALSDFVFVIVVIAGLSFLGLGVRPPTPEWGSMMSEGRLFVATEPWLVLAPGLMLTVLAVGVGLLAEGVLRRTIGSGAR